MPSPDPASPRLSHWARSRLLDERGALDVAGTPTTTRLTASPCALHGAHVLIATRRQATAAAALIELDGLARTIVIAPPDVSDAHRRAIVEDAGIACIVVDDDADTDDAGIESVRIRDTPTATHERPALSVIDTDWVMLTSGTSGRPKLVAHTLAALTGAIPRLGAEAPVVWATFYDIRRYGGLQILLRAIIGGNDIVLSAADEPLDAHLQRLADAGVTSISGTPSHWRKVLMSPARHVIAPEYVRLSGEIADQHVLDALAACYPRARIEHAYASTEAGVAFAVKDGRAGFAASLLDANATPVAMKIEDGSLRIRSDRIASRYVGPGAPPLAGPDGFVDTGDLVSVSVGRVIFDGRRGGIINVGGQKVNPEEVEAVLSGDPLVAQACVRARRSPITGSIVVADVVLRDGAMADDAVRDAILATCRRSLPPHKVPALLRFVPQLALTPAGKIGRGEP